MVKTKVVDLFEIKNFFFNIFSVSRIFCRENWMFKFYKNFYDE